jgi:hypothetical protein
MGDAEGCIRMKLLIQHFVALRNKCALALEGLTMARDSEAMVITVHLNGWPEIAEMQGAN